MNIVVVFYGSYQDLAMAWFVWYEKKMKRPRI